MDEGLDTGDILCQREVHFDEERETFATSYDTLLCEMKTMFRENWEAIRDGRITAVRQTGEGSCHKGKELDAIRKVVPFTWDESVADVKRRIRAAMEKADT